MPKNASVTPTFPTEPNWPTEKARVTLPTREQVLEMTVGLAARIPGNIIEFGVAGGASTRVIRRTLTRHQRLQRRGPKKQVFACDSFEGLSEKFENAEVGTFAADPPKIAGVEMVVGYFENSLTPELAKRVGSVAFASLDADLYSSTMTALRWLTPLLHTGSLLLFDEFIGEDASEKRALEDWCAESGTHVVVLAEFAREPSGWGPLPDRRVLAQVVGSNDLDKSSIAFCPAPNRIVRGGLRRISERLRGKK